MEAKLRIAVRPVDRPREAVQLEAERRFVDARRRRELGPEDSHADPPKAAQGTKSVPVAPRKSNRGVPVGADPELLWGYAPTPLTGDEDHRDPLESAGTPLE